MFDFNHYDYFLVYENRRYNDVEKSFSSFLRKEGFDYIMGGGCPWYFVDITHKSFIPGKPGIKFGRVVGEHAITVKEFKQIYAIYKKYEGKNPLVMK